MLSSLTNYLPRKVFVGGSLHIKLHDQLSGGHRGRLLRLIEQLSRNSSKYPASQEPASGAEQNNARVAALGVIPQRPQMTVLSRGPPGVGEEIMVSSSNHAPFRSTPCERYCT